MHIYGPLGLVKWVTYRGYPDLFTLKGTAFTAAATTMRWFFAQQLNSRVPHYRVLGMLNTHRVSREDWTRDIHVLVNGSIIWLGKSSNLERAEGCKRTQKDVLHKPALLFPLSMHLL